MISLSRSRGYAFVLAVALVLGGGLPSPAAAQISADRPGFGDGTTTVAPGTFQAGLGYAVNGNGVTSQELGQLFLRYGITDALELRGGVGSYVVNESPRDDGYGGSSVGTKVRLFQNATSALSGVATLGLPTGTGAFDTPDDRARQTVKLAFDGALGDGLTLSVNGGASFFYTDDSAVEWLLIPTLSFGLTETTGAYVGYAGFYDDGPNANWVEGGVTLLTTPDTQLDVNTGLRVDDNANDFFVGVGVAHRF
ncbi:MAG: transporter [Salinibacter sp.]